MSCELFPPIKFKGFLPIIFLLLTLEKGGSKNEITGFYMKIPFYSTNQKLWHYTSMEEQPVPVANGIKFYL